MGRVLVLGAGFAGLWTAIGAARKLDELGVGPDRVEVTVVDRSAWHSIRVRNYEADLDGTRVPLDEVLRPIGVRRVEAEAADIDFARREVACTGAGQQVSYDRLVFALGSRLARPPIPVSTLMPSMSTLMRLRAASMRTLPHFPAARRRRTTTPFS